MNAQYLGVYWIHRRDELPEDETMCVYHVKRTVAHRIHFGGYSEKLCSFLDQMTGKWYASGDVDYWMPIPILPEKK